MGLQCYFDFDYDRVLVTEDYVILLTRSFVTVGVIRSRMNSS